MIMPKKVKGPTWTFAERKAYAKAYSSARKTKKGSPKALLGGKYAHEQGVKAVEKLKKKK